MASTTFLLTVAWMFIVNVSGNLICVCNKDNVEQVEVFKSTNSNSTAIGHLNPHQCREYANTSASDPSWLEIQLNGEKGYIQYNADFLLKADCPGTLHLPTTHFPLTFSMATASKHPHPGCINKHISKAHKGDVSLCPAYVVLGAKSRCHLLTQHAHNCYEFTLRRVSWTHANQTCAERGGHLVTIHTAMENTYLHRVLSELNYTRRVWIGLQDRDNEGHFRWVTGEKLSYTHWSTHSTHDRHNNVQDCASMLVSGEWEDQVCGGDDHQSEATTGHNNAYICEYKLHNSGSFIVG